MDTRQKVREHVADAVRHGTRLRAGGEAVRPAPGLTARFFRPTILDDVHGWVMGEHTELKYVSWGV